VKLLERVHAILSSREIPHAVAGAAALAVHGVARSTFDLDVLVRDRACLDPDIWAELVASGATVAIRRGDSEDPLAGVVRLEKTGARPVDVVVGRSPWQDEVLRQARPADLGGAEVPVVSPAGLILLKLYAGGAQDRWDIQQLLALPAAREARAEVDRQLRSLPSRCRKLWRDFARPAR
jgi:hypothetical protein